MIEKWEKFYTKAKKTTTRGKLKRNNDDVRFSVKSITIPFIKENISKKLKSRCRKGIPDAVRGCMWRRLLEDSIVVLDKALAQKTVLALARESTIDLDGDYELDPETGLDARVVDQIDRDTDRTFPKHILFHELNGTGQQMLRTILLKYAEIDKEVGYCQGMGFIAAMFLSYLHEEDAFKCFCAVMLRNEMPLRSLYLPGQ